MMITLTKNMMIARPGSIADGTILPGTAGELPHITVSGLMHRRQTAEQHDHPPRGVEGDGRQRARLWQRALGGDPLPEGTVPEPQRLRGRDGRKVAREEDGAAERVAVGHDVAPPRSGGWPGSGGARKPDGSGGDRDGEQELAP